MQKLSMKEILYYRKKLVNYLKKYDGGKHIIIEPKDNLEEIIFYECSEYDYTYREIAIPMECLRKLDLSGVSFTNVNIENINFMGTKGIVINPQLVYKKNCCGSIFSDTTVVGSFDDVNIDGANFYGSKMNKKTSNSLIKRLTKGVCLVKKI